MNRLHKQKSSSPVVGVVVVLALSGVLGGCGSSSGSAGSDTTNAKQTYALLPPSEVAAAMPKVMTLAKAATASEKGEAKEKVREFLDAWYAVEGSIRKTDQSAYLDMEDALAQITLGAEKGDAKKAAAGLATFEPLVASYLAAQAGATGGAADVAPSTLAPVDRVESIKLDEYTVKAKQQLSPGLVTFSISNFGKAKHELVVLKTDLAPDQLKLDAEGGVEEEQPNVTLVDEHEDIDPGQTVVLTVDLEPGKYLLLCNLTEHFGHKMYLSLTVA